MFDTLDQLSYPAVPAKFAGAEVRYTPTPGDRRLARTMTSTWAAFAKGAMPHWWPPYTTESGMAAEFQDVGATGTLRTIRPDKDANCGALWLTDAMKDAYPK